jgi:hypothetical protein
MRRRQTSISGPSSLPLLLLSPSHNIPWLPLITISPSLFSVVTRGQDRHGGPTDVQCPFCVLLPQEHSLVVSTYAGQGTWIGFVKFDLSLGTSWPTSIFIRTVIKRVFTMLLNLVLFLSLSLSLLTFGRVLPSKSINYTAFWSMLLSKMARSRNFHYSRCDVPWDYLWYTAIDCVTW